VSKKKMTILNRNDSARVLYEVIQQLGWSADKDSIVDLINKLDMGLPAEDEFIFILSWLGKCSLLHKLDQKQFPPKSRPIFQVPDLFAYFSTKFGEKKHL